jgi:ribonucleoside-diphosphate reductase alpha chain
MKVSKQGSTLAGIMDAFSISVSLGLQHGVPLATYVRKYTNMRFEPAGITDDPDLRIATSLVDYIFRRLAVDYLPLEERAELGVLSTSERMQPTLPGVEETATTSTGVVEVETIDPVIATVIDASARDLGEAVAGVEEAQAHAAPAADTTPAADTGTATDHLLARAEPRDAPYCYQCGNAMQRAGSCYVCGSCGTTSGCS